MLRSEIWVTGRLKNVRLGGCYDYNKADVPAEELKADLSQAREKDCRDIVPTAMRLAPALFERGRIRAW